MNNYPPKYFKYWDHMNSYDIAISHGNGYIEWQKGVSKATLDRLKKLYAEYPQYHPQGNALW